MKLVKSFSVSALPERTAEALCSEGFNVDAERDRQEVVDTRYLVTDDDERHLVFEIRSTEYKRTKLGRIDRSGTVESRTRHTFDRDKNTLSWTYLGPGSKWVTVTGVYRLTSEGDATRVVHDIDIQVHVPLLGGKIAKMIAGEFDAAADRFERLLKQHAA